MSIGSSNSPATESTLQGVLSQSDFDTKVGSLTETAPATDTASSGINGRLQRIAQRLTSLIGLLPAALTGSGNFKVALSESTASQAVTNANLDAPLSGLLTTSDFDAKAGSLTETAPATDTASSGLNGRLQRIAQRLTSLIALFPTALSGSGNFKVDVAESTATVTVDSELPAAAALADATTNPTAPQVGAANEVFNGTTWDRLRGDTTNGVWANVKASALPTGAATEATLSTLVTQSDFDTKTGSLTESAPASDTASSGLNGRLQRIAQRITSLIALFPSALSGSGNFKVDVAEVGVQQPVGLGTDAIYSGTTALTPKFAKIAVSSSGANTVVALVGGKKIRVLGFFLIANGTVNVNFQSHTTTATATGLMYLIANTGVAGSFIPVGIFETVAGEALDINLSGAVAVGGQLVYVEV